MKARRGTRSDGMALDGEGEVKSLVLLIIKKE